MYYVCERNETVLQYSTNNYRLTVFTSITCVTFGPAAQFDPRFPNGTGTMLPDSTSSLIYYVLFRERADK